MSATTPGADRLAATTARLAGQRTSIDAADVDLLAAAGSDGVLWQHEGFGLAGRGVALRIALPRGLTCHRARSTFDIYSPVRKAVSGPFRSYYRASSLRTSELVLSHLRRIPRSQQILVPSARPLAGRCDQLRSGQ